MREWLRNKLHNFIFPANGGATAGNDISIREGPEAEIEGLRFTVMPAKGGTIIQLRTYNMKNDRNEYSTYVIPDGEDIAKEVGNIVSLELLRA